MLLQAGVVDTLKDLVGDFFDISRFRDWTLHADKIIIHPEYDSESQ